jgi:hypothetical protein
MNRLRHQTLTQVSQTHRMNLRKNLERRLEIAKARGDENLVRLLEMEASYIG